MRTTTAAIAFVLLVSITGQDERVATQGSPALDNDAAKLSYALGMDLGKQLRAKDVRVEPAILARGLTDALAGHATLMSDEESRALIATLQDDLQRRELTRVALDAENNKRAGEAFLAANKGKEGVVTLASGLQYRVLTMGTGRKPTADDTVTCHYRGRFIDGREFDNSSARGAAPTFPLTQVIKGWSEALQLMPAGSRWEIFVPAELAYGSRGAGGRIAPNTTLVFELELLAVR